MCSICCHMALVYCIFNLRLFLLILFGFTILLWKRFKWTTSIVCMSVCLSVRLTVASHIIRNQWSDSYQSWHGDCKCALSICDWRQLFERTDYFPLFVDSTKALMSSELLLFALYIIVFNLNLFFLQLFLSVDALMFLAFFFLFIHSLFDKNK